MIRRIQICRQDSRRGSGESRRVPPPGSCRKCGCHITDATAQLHGLLRKLGHSQLKGTEDHYVECVRYASAKIGEAAQVATTVTIHLV